MKRIFVDLLLINGFKVDNQEHFEDSGPSLKDHFSILKHVLMTN